MLQLKVGTTRMPLIKKSMVWKGGLPDRNINQKVHFGENVCGAGILIGIIGPYAMAFVNVLENGA
jgi:hypothetical protein